MANLGGPIGSSVTITTSAIDIYYVQGSAGKPFNFQVKSVYPTGKSIGSNTVSVTPPQLPVPTISLLSLTPLGCSLGWTKITEANGYKIIETTGKEFSPKESSRDNGVDITFPANSVGKVYNFQVKSLFAGTGLLSDSSNNIAMIVPSPQPPTRFLVNTSSPVSCVLGWTAAPGATSYQIVEASNQNFGTNRTSTTNSINITYPEISSGKTFKFQVKSIYTAGMTSGLSDILEVIVPELVPPQSLNKTNVSDAGFTLGWTAAPGASSYKVIEEDKQRFAVAYPSDETQPFADIVYLNKMGGQAYKFQVKAMYVEIAAPPSNSVSVTLPMAAPVGLGFPKLNSGYCEIVWQYVPDATSYEIYETTGKVFGSNLFFSERNGATIYQPTITVVWGYYDRAAGTTYTFAVKAIGSSGTKSVASTISVTIPG